MFSEQSQQHHAMELVGKDESGAEEWYCPTCGRRFLMQWPPEYKKVILEAGDEYAIHSGGKGGVSLNPPVVSVQDNYQEEDSIDTPIDEADLYPWIKWMDEVNFDQLWDRNYQ